MRDEESPGTTGQDTLCQAGVPNPLAGLVTDSAAENSPLCVILVIVWGEK